MDARLVRAALLAATLASSMGASARTANFIVNARDPQFANQVAQSAEKFRRDLAIEWLGQELPRWAQPCPITVEEAPNLGAGGATSFMFERGEVFGWRMRIQGSAQRILDSVLPHEVTHTIFASHFRRPLPRWADEGACTTVEHDSEKAKHRQMLVQFLHTNRGIAFSDMFVMKEYPRDVMPLYAQGYSLASFLIAHGGKRRFVKYLEDGLNGPETQWIAATRDHYGFPGLSELQDAWLNWVRMGMPNIAPRDNGVIVASAEGPADSAGQGQTFEPTSRTGQANGPNTAKDSDSVYLASAKGMPKAASQSDDLVAVRPRRSTNANGETRTPRRYVPAPDVDPFAGDRVPTDFAPRNGSANSSNGVSEAGGRRAIWTPGGTSLLDEPTEVVAARETNARMAGDVRAAADVQPADPRAASTQSYMPTETAAFTSASTEPIRNQVHRPQPPRQVLMEWSRPDGIPTRDPLLGRRPVTDSALGNGRLLR